MLDEKDRHGISEEEKKKRDKEFAEMARAPGNILEWPYDLVEKIMEITEVYYDEKLKANNQKWIERQLIVVKADISKLLKADRPSVTRMEIVKVFESMALHGSNYYKADKIIYSLKAKNIKVKK